MRRRRHCSWRRCRRALRNTWWLTQRRTRRGGRFRGFSEFQTAGDAGLKAIIDGSVGKIKDFFVFRSQFIPYTGTNPVTTHNLAFTRDAIGLVIRRFAAAAAWDRGDCGVRRIGQLRHAGGNELPAGYVGPAVHGGHSVRLRDSAEYVGSAGEYIGPDGCGSRRGTDLQCRGPRHAGNDVEPFHRRVSWT